MRSLILSLGLIALLPLSSTARAHRLVEILPAGAPTLWSATPGTKYRTDRAQVRLRCDVGQRTWVVNGYLQLSSNGSEACFIPRPAVQGKPLPGWAGAALYNRPPVIASPSPVRIVNSGKVQARPGEILAIPVRGMFPQILVEGQRIRDPLTQTGIALLGTSSSVVKGKRDQRFTLIQIAPNSSVETVALTVQDLRYQPHRNQYLEQSWPVTVEIH